MPSWRGSSRPRWRCPLRSPTACSQATWLPQNPHRAPGRVGAPHRPGSALLAATSTPRSSNRQRKPGVPESRRESAPAAAPFAKWGRPSARAGLSTTRGNQRNECVPARDLTRVGPGQDGDQVVAVPGAGDGGRPGTAVDRRALPIPGNRQQGRAMRGQGLAGPLRLRVIAAGRRTGQGPGRGRARSVVDHDAEPHSSGDRRGGR